MPRRGLAGFLLTLGFLAGSFAISASWMRATVFDPARTVAVADELLDDDAVKDDLARRLTGPLAEANGSDPASMAPEIRARLEDPSVLALLATTASDIHAALIGDGVGDGVW
jgi:hypothetical protein